MSTARYIGIDLHRNKFTCCVLLENGRTYLSQWKLEDLPRVVKKLRPSDQVAVEIDDGFPEDVRQDLRERGHDTLIVPHVAGGMNAIAFNADGSLTGAACWRADGTPVGIGGGPARANVRFWPEGPRR